jgi:hypothetical protein
MSLTISGPVKTTKGQQSIHIHPTKSKVNARLQIVSFQDMETRQIVMLVPALKLTAYGTTDSRAYEMMKLVLNDYFDYLTSLGATGINKELTSLGFKAEKYRKKDYSTTHVDEKGVLREFNPNALPGTLEIRQLQTA